MNSNKNVLLSLCAVFAYLSGADAHSEREAEQARINMRFVDRIIENGTINFTLSIPYRSMFRDEKPWLAYGIQNSGHEEVLLTSHVIGEMSTGDIQDGQMWFQFGKGDQFKWNFHPEIGRNWARMTNNRNNMHSLKNGKAVFATSRDGSYFLNESAAGYDKVRGAILVSENQYVASNWCDITIIPKSLKDGAKFMEIDYGSPIYKAPLYINELDGERWIFIQNYRVSKVPEKTEPVFDVDKNTSIMTIKFMGGDYEPVVHNVRMIRTLSGPRELVPHLYLQDAIKRSFSKVEHPGVDNESQSPSGRGASHTGVSVEKPPNRILWVILSGLAAMSIGISTIVIRRHCEQKHENAKR